MGFWKDCHYGIGEINARLSSFFKLVPRSGVPLRGQTAGNMKFAIQL